VNELTWFIYTTDIGTLQSCSWHSYTLIITQPLARAVHHLMIEW